MFGKIFAQLLGNTEEGTDLSVENETFEELLESEDGEWVVINIQENRSLGITPEDPLENLLIEHPSMSVYQMCHQRLKEEDCSDEDDTPRPVALRRVSWLVAAGLVPSPCGSLHVSLQRARAYEEGRRLNRSALNRHNLAKTRFSPSDRRYGYFKQPSQRLYNY